jgi:hypothetical protein
MSRKKRPSPLETFIAEVETYVKSFDLPAESIEVVDEKKVDQAMSAIRNEIVNVLTRASEGYDAPESARNNARKVLKWKEKYGKECRGMTAVGWARARDLGNGSKLSASTVKRMASFNRHRGNYEKARNKPESKSKPWTIPAIVAWLGWGGTSGVEWAIRTSQSIQNKSKKRK